MLVKRIKAHMWAYAQGKIREVTIPVADADDVPSLEDVFYFGQNDFAVGPEKNSTPSLSVGDVVELDGRFHRVESCGFKEMSSEEYEAYTRLPDRERRLF